MLHLSRIGLVVLTLAGPSGSAAAADPQAFFEGTRHRLTRIAATPENERRRACDALTGDIFDLTALARKVASTDDWNVMRRETRDQLTKAVAGRLARECVALVDHADPAAAQVAKIRDVAGGVRLTVLMPDAQGKERVVVWSLRAGGRLGWTATDLSIDGRAAGASFHQDFENARSARPGPISGAVAYFAAMGAK